MSAFVPQSLLQSHRPAMCDPSHWSGSQCQHSFHNLCFKVTGQQCVIQAIEVGLNVSIRSTICASKSQASNVWSKPLKWVSMSAFVPQSLLQSHRPAMCDPSHWSGSKCQHSFHNLCFKVTGQQCVIQAIEVGLNVSIRSTICPSKSQASNVWSKP